MLWAPQSARRPILGPRHQARAERVAFDVSPQGQQMSIALNGKAFETALVHVASSSRVAHGVKTFGVSTAEKLKKTPTGPILFGTVVARMDEHDSYCKKAVFTRRNRYGEAVVLQSPGSRRAPWDRMDNNVYPEGQRCEAF